MTPRAHLAKYHGLGNDFLVILDEDQTGALDVTPAHAVKWCDRHTGIGADGLLHGLAPAPGACPGDSDVDVVMRLYNADGSRAEMSGNGVRCFGHAVALSRGIEKGTLRVLTDAGVKVLDIEPGEGADAMQIAVDMGTAGPGPEVPDGLGMQLPGRHATVDMGNPHLVIEVADPSMVDLAAEGRWLEHQFEHGVNVEFIASDGLDRLELTVWERGAGITQACGTGACAAVVAAHGWGVVGNDVVVSMPGGDARVTLGESGAVTLIGPSVRIAAVEVSVEDR